ncbi:MAG: hypothetical protein ACTHU0_21550 [Kofleriaceae bacterium]
MTRGILPPEAARAEGAAAAECPAGAALDAHWLGAAPLVHAMPGEPDAATDERRRYVEDLGRQIAARRGGCVVLLALEIASAAAALGLTKDDVAAACAAAETGH